MIRFRVLTAVTKLTIREFIRTPEAIFWTYGFPLLMAVCLGLAFRSSEPVKLPIAVVESDFAAAQMELLRANPRLQPALVDRAAAEYGFVHGDYLLVVSGSPVAPTIKLDPVRPESELAKLQVERALRGTEPVAAIEVQTPGSRYIDWLIPGLLGLNLLGAGMWGVGFNLVQMRIKNILRRLMVTPMHRSEFLTAFLLSRLSLVIPEAAVILAFGHFAFDMPIPGSYLTIFVFVVLGGVCFTGLGMLLASRARTIETVSGLMNLVMLPMWMLGGCFFSSERFPDFVQPLVKALPITHFNNGMRAILLDGAGFAGAVLELAFLAGFGLLTLGLAIRCFRWT